MLRRLIGLVVAACAVAPVAACGDGVAIEVIVPEGMNADQLDLYIALDTCDFPVDADVDADGELDGCTKLQAPGSSFLDGRVFYLDARLHLDIPGPGTYAFRLERDRAPRVPTVVAVASRTIDANTPRDSLGVAVIDNIRLDDGALRIRAELAQAESLDQSNKHGVAAWNTADAFCVGATRNDNVVFVVDRDDPDCDGLVDTAATDPSQLECNPLSYLGQLADSPGLTCVARNTVDRFCELGASACVDAMGHSGCSGQNLCASNQICLACEGNPDLAQCFDAARAVTTKLACVLPAAPNGNGQLETCDASPTGKLVANLDESLFQPVMGTATECTDIAFASPDTPLSLDLGTYQDHLDIATNPNDPTEQLTFTVQANAPQCYFELQYDAPLPPSVALGKAYPSTVMLEIKNPAGDRRKMVLPVVVTVTSCADEATCAVIDDASAAADCLQ